MVKKFSEFINEWVSTSTREFEGINNMSIDEISEYLLNTYPEFYDPGRERNFSSRKEGLFKPKDDGIIMSPLDKVDFIITKDRGNEYECFLHFDNDIDPSKRLEYLKFIKNICSLKEDKVEGVRVVNVLPLDNEVLTIEFCVDIIDKLTECDPDNARYVKA